MAPRDFVAPPWGGHLPIASTGVGARRSETLEEAAGGLAAPDHPALRALAGALMCAGRGAAPAGWRPVEVGAQITRRIGLEPVGVRLLADSGEAAWRELCAVTPLALDVLAVVVAGFSGRGGEVRLVRCAEVLEAKGCRRWGEERQALEAQIARELMRIGRFAVGRAEQPVFSVTPVGERPTSFVVNLDPALAPAWSAAPLRRLPPRVLTFDHRLNRGADVLAKKLGLHLCLSGADSRPLVRSVRALLRAVGAMNEVAGGARGGRLADRFEEAILRLEENHLFAFAYRRVDAALELRMKGWVKTWLDAELVIEPCG